ncbi:alpha-ketoglutarate-dependent dioxygenase AlkB [Flavobacterium magnum]|uniref:Alpha-ketoglutarate-dependent dioxygenase AlkB n=1 Tax=Flavobacterium magnum TaxID=2162713 RepID=A0A2S0RGH7_9FLAO|nr:alpha-ketoglutarate-dependent dioxygenase AlkB [Flavobacterium magnum]AWA29822.1 alpha-ketoglutarate-dependent dioxygenase AlkB [Flavobacterium magnum]
MAEPVTFRVPDAEIRYYPHVFTSERSHELMQQLLDDILWQRDDITLFGKTHPQPRLTALYGNEGKPYSYSGIVMAPHPWSPLLTYIKEEVERISGHTFTTVLLNLYRDGRDSNGWHADDEKELGRNPAIASVSFGAERFFHMKHNSDPQQKLKILLENGSMLLMEGSTQHFWKHQLPKTSRPVGARINLTFRSIR